VRNSVPIEVPEAAATSAWLNGAVAELRGLLVPRAAVLAPEATCAGADEKSAHDTGLGDDLAEANLLDTTSASSRFNYPRNTIAKWCRDEDLGVMRGGRWLVSIPRLQRRLNGS